jgi:ankyrin repeat protein
MADMSAQLHRAALLILFCLATGLSAAGGNTQPKLPFSMPDEQTSVTLPLDRGHFQLYARATFGSGRVGYFLVDTGSAVSLIDADVADEMKLPPLGHRVLQRPNGPSHHDVVVLPRLDLGPLSVERHPMLTEHQWKTAPDGRLMCGLVGMDVVGRGPFTIDFRAATLTLYRPERFTPPAGTPAVALRPSASTPIVRAGVEGHEGWFSVDSGMAEFLLSRAFAQMNPDLTSGVALSERPPWGATAEEYGTFWHSIDLPGKKISPAFGYYQAGRSGLENIAGLLGAGMFRDARVTIDVSSQRAWFEWLTPEKLEDLEHRLQGLGKADLHGASPLLHAALILRADAASALIDRGMDPNDPDDGGITPLMVAAGRGDTDTTRLLLTRGAKWEARSKLDGYTALVLAAQYGRIATIPLLLDAKADVDQASDSGRTPLFVAADADRTDAVKLLIARGAKADLALPTGETPLIAACRNGSAACVALLLDSRANPNAAGARGTALIYAARAGSPECLRLLLAKGADVKKLGPNRLTPLMAAAGSPSDAECVRLLLNAGADPTAKDSAGRTAYDYALQGASTEAISMLALPEQ